MDDHWTFRWRGLTGPFWGPPISTFPFFRQWIADWTRTPLGFLLINGAVAAMLATIPAEAWMQPTVAVPVLVFWIGGQAVAWLRPVIEWRLRSQGLL